MIDLIVNHPTVVISVLVIIIILLKTTSWGRANTTALDSVIDVIEANADPDLKDAIDKSSANNSQEVQSALTDAQDKANPAQPNPNKMDIAVRESARTFGNRLAKATGDAVARLRAKDDQ